MGVCRVRNCGEEVDVPGCVRAKGRQKVLERARPRSQEGRSPVIAGLVRHRFDFVAAWRSSRLKSREPGSATAQGGTGQRDGADGAGSRQQPTPSFSLFEVSRRLECSGETPRACRARRVRETPVRINCFRFSISRSRSASVWQSSRLLIVSLPTPHASRCFVCHLDTQNGRRSRGAPTEVSGAR